MAKYTEEEISKIIIDVEKLIETQDIPVENDSKFYDVKKVENPKNVILNRYHEEINNSEDFFEECFNTTRKKRQNIEIPEPINYADIFCLPECSKVSKEIIKPNSQKAITINTELKHQLIKLRENLEHMKSNVDERLKILEEFLEDVKSNEKESVNSKTTYAKCGAPFFKDALGYPAPENKDFKYRKNMLKEFFPFNLSNTSSWDNDDKTLLVQGIKEQMINYIQTQQSKKLCQESKKTRGKMQKIRYIFNNKDLQETSMLKLYETIQKEYPDFWTNGINWNILSFSSLEGKHTVSECMGMWHSYLRPDINREPFSDEENAILADAVVENKNQNWEVISDQLERRTSLQTFIHYNSEQSRLCPPNVRWTPDEDLKLINAVKTHTRAKNILWHKVGTAIENRNKTQCYNRYLILMRQRDSKKGVFKPYEDRILLDFVAKYGSDFSKMPPDLLPNRSIVQIKNHFNVALKHKGKVNPWTREEDKMLMDFVAKEGTNSWYKIAEILKTHNRLSCRTRYTTIQKFLQKNPDKTLADTPSRLKTVTAVHKAIQSEEVENNEYSNEFYEKSMSSKSFGILTFEDFKLKNPILYNLLKTNYNYRLTVNEINIDNFKFLVLKKLLDIDDIALRNRTSYLLTVGQHRKLKEVLCIKLDSKIKDEIKVLHENFNFYLPPNYNTAIGLRAVTIKIIDQPKIFKKVDNFSKEYHEALNRFQKLFRLLFYWPAMISKLKESDLRSKYFIRDSRNNTIEILNFFQKDH